jgi:hypothetical protein
MFFGNFETSKSFSLCVPTRPSPDNTQVHPQNAKKSLKAPLCHKTMWAWKLAQHFPRAKTPYSASFPVPEGAGCWPWRSTLVGLAAPNPQKLSTAPWSYPQKIYENIAFYRFQSLSVEIIEEKNRQKVIHSQFISPCYSRETRQFGRTQVVQINI